MGRSTSQEKKTEWVRFRIKPSLKQRILEAKQKTPHRDGELKDFIVALIYMGLEKAHPPSVQIPAAEREQKEEIKGGATRERQRIPSSPSEDN